MLLDFSDRTRTGISKLILSISPEKKVEGGWSNWSEWSDSDCPFTLEVVRKRICDNPTPKFGGLACQGDRRDVRDCEGT